jgi:hypothetical protein
VFAMVNEPEMLTQMILAMKSAIIQIPLLAY